MVEAILIKLGGSLITDKRRAETARLEVIARLAQEIAQASRPGLHLILGHGSGSFGHVAAFQHNLASGLHSPDQRPGISLTQHRAADLHRLVVNALLEAGAAPFSIAPSSAIVFAAGQPAAFAAEPLHLALANGLLPVLYGDVVLDREKGIAICSTEKALEMAAQALLSTGVVIRRALWLGETAGILDSRGSTVPHIADRTQAEALAQALGEPAGIDVTGGIRHRLDTTLTLAAQGIPSLLADGRVPGLLPRALAGEPVPGTTIGSI